MAPSRGTVSGEVDGVSYTFYPKHKKGFISVPRAALSGSVSSVRRDHNFRLRAEHNGDVEAAVRDKLASLRRAEVEEAPHPASPTDESPSTSAVEERPRRLRTQVDPFDPGKAFDFDGCVMKDVFGSVVPKNCARASEVGLESQTVRLEDFAHTLDRDRVVAVRVAADEADIEGVLWFAILDDLPIKLTEATMHAGQEFEKGWLVAHGHWFSLQGAPAANGDRTYAILPEVVMLNVNSMLRVISPIVFNAANKNARPRRARGGGFNTTTTYLLNHSDWERLTSLL
jgi:hypothetical protein